MDDIPIAASPNRHPSNNTPLNSLPNSWNDNDDILLIRIVENEAEFSQVFNSNSAKSKPVLNRKFKSQKARDSLRSQRKKQKLNCTVHKKSKMYRLYKLSFMD